MLQFEANLKESIKNEYCVPEWVKNSTGDNEMKFMARRMMTRPLP